MTKKNTILAFVLTGAIAFTLAGCNEKKDKQANGGDAYTIKWYNFGPQVRESDMVFEEVSKYTMDKIGVKVKLKTIETGEYSEKMRLLMASKDEFDMCFAADYTNFFSNAVRNSYLPMDDLLKEEGKDILKIYPKYVFASGRVNGKQYALPAYKDFSIQNTIQYNLKDVKELGFDVSTVKKPEDIEPCLEAFKKKYPDSYPLNLSPQMNFFSFLGYIPIEDISSVGSVDIYGDGKKIINPFETKKAKDLMKLMSKWYKLGYIAKDAATSGSSGAAKKSIMGFSVQLPYQRQVSNLALPDEFKAGDIMITEPWLTSTGGSMQAISRTSKDPKATMKFMNLLNTDKKLRNMVSLGIENKHWVAVGENNFKLPAGVKNRTDNGYYTLAFTQGNVYLTRQLEGTPEDIYDKYKEFDDKALKSPALGFTFDATPVVSEIAAVKNVYNEFFGGLLTGVADPDTYLSPALEKLKVAGVDKVMAEMQSQYDTWKKTK